VSYQEYANLPSARLRVGKANSEIFFITGGIEMKDLLIWIPRIALAEGDDCAALPPAIKTMHDQLVCRGNNVVALWPVRLMKKVRCTVEELNEEITDLTRDSFITVFDVKLENLEPGPLLIVLHRTTGTCSSFRWKFSKGDFGEPVGLKMRQ